MPYQSISNDQRKALRRWFQSQYPKPRQADCSLWFERQYKHRLSQSTVSEILSAKYKHLDNGENLSSTSSFRQRSANWPILESILSDWERSISQQGGFLNSQILVEKARQIWPQIPQYQHLPTPEFSVGWLANFKKRHHIQKRAHHGEASSTPLSAAEEMKNIRTLCGEYNEEDVYNMDETGLFWRRAPSTGLSSNSLPGIKKDKTRITLVACVNCTGADRLPLWIIGNSKVPRSLRGLNIQALGGIWTSNKKSWMTSLIMKDWLLAFYAHIGRQRSVLLIMDNFPAHIGGVELAPPPTNIRVQWLPSNSTSIYQPLDQGILQNMKVYYKRRWLHYMIEQYEMQLDPLSTITLNDAVHWILSAWKHEVTNTTIYNCFRKSTVIQPQLPNLPSDPIPDLSTLYCEVQRTGHIHEAISLENFLDPVEENIVDMGEPVDLDSIIALHTQDTTNFPVEEDQGDEEDSIIIQPPPTAFQALQAIRTVLRFQEYAPSSQHEDINVLQRLERQLQQQELDSRTQRTLDSWLM